MVTAHNLFIYQKREENEEEEKQEKNKGGKMEKDSFIPLFLTVFGFGFLSLFFFFFFLGICLVKHQNDIL